MKKSIFTILFLITLATVGLAQTKGLSNKTVSHYIVTDDSQKFKTLERIEDFNDSTKYSKINTTLLRKGRRFILFGHKYDPKGEMKNRDTEIWYYLIKGKVYKRMRY